MPVITRICIMTRSPSNQPEPLSLESCPVEEPPALQLTPGTQALEAGPTLVLGNSKPLPRPPAPLQVSPLPPSPLRGPGPAPALQPRCPAASFPPAEGHQCGSIHNTLQGCVHRSGQPEGRAEMPLVDILPFADGEAEAPPHTTCTGPRPPGLKLALPPQCPPNVLTPESQSHPATD